MQTASPMTRMARCKSTGRREPAGHVEAIAPLRRGVRGVCVLTVTLSLLLLAAPASAHDAKEYTMLLKEDGVTPSGVPPGVLVSTDSLFFYNVDSREEVIHRVLIDADGDGEFEGVDDMATAWLSPSCELDENGDKVDPECEVTELVLLDPSNGLLPGDISMLHQIDHNQSLTESVFTVSFSDDQHTVTDDPPVVANPLSNVSVTEDASDTTIDLSNVFNDVDDDNASIAKAAISSDTSLVTVSVSGDVLTLDYQGDQHGTATITVTATSNGQTVSDSFKVTVTEVNDLLVPVLLASLVGIVVILPRLMDSTEEK